MVRKLFLSKKSSSPHQLCFIDRLSVVSGVPQGSVLGALLFSIYVNDPPNICQNCSTECYVDDTRLLLSFSVNDPTQAMESVYSDLQRIRNWCFDNCLMLNPHKTKLMVFSFFFYLNISHCLPQKHLGLPRRFTIIHV